DLVRWALRTALRFTGFDPKIVAQAEQSVGRRLGEATLSEDIRYVLDDLDESVLLGIAEVAAIGTHRWLLRLVRAVPVRAGWGHSLGRIATAQIEMASAYIEELEKLLPHQETGRSLATLTTDFREHDAAL